MRKIIAKYAFRYTSSIILNGSINVKRAVCWE